jgi:hypothetical protein
MMLRQTRNTAVRFCSRETLVFLFGGALALAVGCDLTGEYEAEFKKALSSAGQRAVFDQSLHPSETDLTDAARKSVGVRLRLPKLFDKDSKSLPATEARATPPFMRFPGLSYALERQIDDDKGQFMPAYVHFGAVPKADQKADALQAAIAQQVAAALPGAAWADAPLQTPDGQSITFKRLQATGPQDFMNLQTNQPIKLDGRFDLYLIDAPAHYVLIGWRAPKAQADKYQFSTAAEAAMGTAIVQPGSADPAASGKPAPGCF